MTHINPDERKPYQRFLFTYYVPCYTLRVRKNTRSAAATYWSSQRIPSRYGVGNHSSVRRFRKSESPVRTSRSLLLRSMNSWSRQFAPLYWKYFMGKACRCQWRRPSISCSSEGAEGSGLGTSSGSRVKSATPEASVLEEMRHDYTFLWYEWPYNENRGQIRLNLFCYILISGDVILSKPPWLVGGGSCVAADFYALWLWTNPYSLIVLQRKIAGWGLDEQHQLQNRVIRKHCSSVPLGPKYKANRDIILA